MVKITPKTFSATTASTIATTSSPTTIVGKTAIKTANGQIIYIQKATSGQRLTTATTAAGTTATIAGTTPTSLATTAAGSNKTVAIQVIRAASGSLMTTTAAAAKQQLSGKKIIIKAPLKTSTSTTTKTIGNVVATSSGTIAATSSTTTATTTTAVAATTLPKDALKVGMKIQKISGLPTSVTAAATVAGTPITTASGKIVVQSANGKQIVVSNQNLIKLSPKPTTTITTTAATTVAGNTSGNVQSGQLQAIQIPGKGLQYVRVVPNTKITVSAAAATTTSSSSTVTSSTTATTSTSTLKILNTMPQKFTVVRPNAVTKFMLTQSPKKETSGVTFSPVTSKVQKTIVTVPTLRPIADGSSAAGTGSTGSSSSNSPSSQGTLVKHFLSGNSDGNVLTTNSGGFNIVRKHKISDLNSEIQRITTTTATTGTTASGSEGAGEPKTAASGQRFVVMSRSMLQPRHGTVQRVTVQGGPNTKASASVSANATLPQKQFSVLKSTTGSTSNSYSSPAQAEIKSLIICGQAKALMAQQQQQHKSYMLKRQFQQQFQQKLLSTTASTSTSSSSAPKLVTNAPQPSFVKIWPKQQQQQLVDEEIDVKPSLDSLAEEAGATRAPRRKHCNCSKSQCLKLYCDCFANGEFCQDCTCKDCFNNLQYEDERQRAIKTCLERNPSAFKPKITTARDQGDMRLHNKGCNCKRSGCLKNYCECYEAKIPCSSNCKCVGCRNIEDRPDLDMDPIDPKIMATIANASASYASGGGAGVAQKRNYDRANSSSGPNRSSHHNEKMLKEAAKALAIHSGSTNNNDLMSAGGSSSSSVIGGNIGGGVGLNPGSPPDKQQQSNFITQEVIDATIQCMISQADECEKNGLPAYQTEKMIMEELGRCLVEIIDFSIRNTDSSYAQE